jgi:hexosaminidase
MNARCGCTAGAPAEARAVRRFLLAIIFVAAATRAGNADPALIPSPAQRAGLACRAPLALTRPLAFASGTDVGGAEIVGERWRALGIPAPGWGRGAGATVSVRGGLVAPAGTYTLRVDERGVRIAAVDGEAAFDALATLAQLPERDARGWHIACTSITDRPALRWRIVSDDISRGPFPTMAYFKTRIRTLAGLKINGYSPYMEQVFADPAHPYVAFPERLTAAELHELATYARRFHVALIPQQQTFAHMHEALKWETLAPLGELPHGYLLAESDPATYAYLEPLLRAELAAVGTTPFFHVGADEPLDLGRGRTPRSPQVFADHVKRVAAIVSAGGARPMIWDDAIQADSSILALIPKSTVIVTFHYGAEPRFAPYIATIDRAGFDQLVSPGANNWNELYADLDTAYANEARFLADAKAAHSPHVLGMFETVWHDDGESLYESTWAPLAFAAATAWQTGPVDRTTWHRDFAQAFFGTDAAGFGADLDDLAALRAALAMKPESDPPDYLFWADPFDPRIQARMQTLDLADIRRRAERVFTHLASARPPLNVAAAQAMRLAALRYDVLARRYQIGKEARDYYDDARAHAGAHQDGIVYRSLNVAKYLCWELRDEMTALKPLYAAAWDRESRPAGRDRVLVRYDAAAQRAVAQADKLYAAAREDYLRAGTLPTFDDALGATR